MMALRKADIGEYIRGVIASASLKPPSIIGVDPAWTGEYPRRYRLGLIEAGLCLCIE